jgi:hypothetical protein
MTTCGQHIREQTSDRTQRRRVRRAEEHQEAACRLARENAETMKELTGWNLPCGWYAGGGEGRLSAPPVCGIGMCMPPPWCC